MTRFPTLSAGRRTAGALAAIVLALAGQGAGAATFGELSRPANTAGAAQIAAPVAGPYAGAPAAPCPPDCGPAPLPMRGGPEGVPPLSPGFGAMPYVPPLAAAPRAFLPLAPYASAPDDRLMLWSFGQINATTDPYQPWGLSTPYMFVPWSTPLAGWTNAATWNWWRERSGALPRNW